MSLSADIYKSTKKQIESAVSALDGAAENPVSGVAQARASIKSARATLRLLEPSSPNLASINERLRDVVGTLGPIRDTHVVRPSDPPPLEPSMLKTLTDARSAADACLDEFLSHGKPKVSVDDLVLAAGASYRQARRRFLRALPEDEDVPFDVEALHQCRKATQRVYLQLDCILGGNHTKRSERFGLLSDLLGQHRDLVVLSAASDQSQWQLESAITKVGLETYQRKPSAYREWLHTKISSL